MSEWDEGWNVSFSFIASGKMKWTNQFYGKKLFRFFFSFIKIKNYELLGTEIMVFEIFFIEIKHNQNKMYNQFEYSIKYALECIYVLGKSIGRVRCMIWQPNKKWWWGHTKYGTDKFSQSKFTLISSTYTRKKK